MLLNHLQKEPIEDPPEGLESIPGLYLSRNSVHCIFYGWFTDIYDRALEAKLVQVDIEELIPLVLARAGYEKRKVEAGDAGEEIIV